MQTREDMLKGAKDICEQQLFIIEQINARKQQRTDDMISDLIA